MKSIRYATYLTIALHFARLALKQVFTRKKYKLYKAPGTTITAPSYTTKVVLFYKLHHSDDLYAVEFYINCSAKAETLFNYLDDSYPSFKDCICIFDSGSDIQYELKMCLDSSLRETIFNTSPILGQPETISDIIVNTIQFCENHLSTQISFKSLKVCKVE